MHLIKVKIEKDDNTIRYIKMIPRKYLNIKIFTTKSNRGMKYDLQKKYI